MRMTGELDLRAAPAFRALVQREMAASERLRHLILDMRGVTFIDSSGVGAILGRCRDVAAARAGKVVAFGPRPNVRRVLEFAGLPRVLAMTETQRQALAIVKEGNSAS